MQRTETISIGSPTPLHTRLIGKWGRPLAFGLTAALLLADIFVVAARYRAFDSRGLVGVDYRLFMDQGRRWIEHGTIYLPYQLSGPFAYDVGAGTNDVASMPSLYPPLAGPVFAAWTAIPASLWWLIPIGTLAFMLVRWHPAPWSWPLLAAVPLFPNTSNPFLTGNTTMWIVAGVAAGLVWGWPALAVAVKPSFAPLMLIGVRHRSWWIGSALLIGVSVLIIGEWLRYLTVLRNMQSPGLLYSLWDAPLVMAPIVAWLGRQKPTDAVKPAIDMT